MNETAPPITHMITTLYTLIPVRLRYTHNTHAQKKTKNKKQIKSNGLETHTGWIVVVVATATNPNNNQTLKNALHSSGRCNERGRAFADLGLGLVQSLTDVFRVVQSWYVDITSLPRQEAAERHQKSFVGVDGTDENRHVVTLTVFVFRPDFGVVLARMRLL